MKLHHLPISLAILLLLGFASGCGSSNGPTTSTSSGFIRPLTIGNRWIERANVGNNGGSVIDTMVISDTVAPFGGVLYREDHWPKLNFDTTKVYLYTNNSAGLFVMPVEKYVYAEMKSIGNISGSSTLLAKYPASIGDTVSTEILTTESAPNPIGRAILLVGSTNDVVTVPAGTFSCYRYDWILRYDSLSYDSPIQSSEYYAPGIGHVKSTTGAPGHSADTRVLLSADIK